MNWQTEDLLKQAERDLCDGCVFSEDQLATLRTVLKYVKLAIEKESNCIRSGINYER